MPRVPLVDHPAARQRQGRRASAPPVAVIADDGVLGLRLMADAAEKAGLVALTFDNGTDALAAAQSQDVALVLLDVNMSGLDGVEVCRRLRQSPKFAHVPVVIVTADGDTAEIDQAFAAGATGFIARPVNWVLLPYHLRHALRNAALLRAAAGANPGGDTTIHAGPGSGVNVPSFSAALGSRLRDWLELEAWLLDDATDDWLSLAFQPRFRLHDNVAAGVTVQARWNDAEFGDVVPDRLAAIVRENGLLLEMGAWVARVACRQLRVWQQMCLYLPITIPLSDGELQHGNPAGTIEAEAAAAGVPASMIEVEIAASAMASDSIAVRSAIERLRQLGCRVALGDFGTGRASLACLARDPPDRLAINGPLVANVDRSQQDAVIVNAILSLAHGLGMTVTANDVDRAGQLEWLRSRGCHEAQGQLLSHAVSAAALERQLRERRDVAAIAGFAHSA